MREFPASMSGMRRLLLLLWVGFAAAGGLQGQDEVPPSSVPDVSVPELKELSAGLEGAERRLAELRAELKKVHWPARNETNAATVVVLVLVAIIALYLGVVDFLLSQIVQTILN